MTHPDDNIGEILIIESTAGSAKDAGLGAQRARGDGPGSLQHGWEGTGFGLMMRNPLSPQGHTGWWGSAQLGKPSPSGLLLEAQGGGVEWDEKTTWLEEGFGNGATKCGFKDPGKWRDSLPFSALISKLPPQESGSAAEILAPNLGLPVTLEWAGGQSLGRGHAGGLEKELLAALFPFRAQITHFRAQITPFPCRDPHPNKQRGRTGSHSLLQGPILSLPHLSPPPFFWHR